MKKKPALYAAAALFVLLAVVLLARKFLTAAPTAAESEQRQLDIQFLKTHAAAIAALKAKCGLETKLENEAACQCDAETRINRQVDEVEELLISQPALENVEFTTDDGRTLKAKALLDERLPETPECTPQ